MVAKEKESFLFCQSVAPLSLLGFFKMGDLVRKASIGDEGFQEEMQAGQAAAADAELLDYNQNDRMEDIMADFPLQTCVCGSI